MPAAPSRIIAVVLVGMLALPLLAACKPDGPTPSSSPTALAPKPSATKSPTPTPTVEAAPALSFVAPTTCADLIGPDLAAQFASRNIELFNSTNGEGVSTFSEFRPHQDGGNPFGCLYGVQGVDLNTFTLTAQPLSQAAHEGVVSILDGGGYTKTVDGTTVTYLALGAETGAAEDQLTIHILRPDSWITGWASLGGEQRRADIQSYLDTVAANLYK